MASRQQIEGDARYWLDQLRQVSDPDQGRRFLNAFLGELYRLYQDVLPKKNKDAFFLRMWADDDSLLLDTLAMFVRGAGVHDLSAKVETPHQPLTPSPSLYTSESLYPGVQFHFPPRDPALGKGSRSPSLSTQTRADAYDRLIEGAPIIPILERAMNTLAALALGGSQGSASAP